MDGPIVFARVELVWVASNVPSIFLSLCAQTISCVRHFVSTHLYEERHVCNMCKRNFQNENYVRSKFPCVRSSQDQCACAQPRGTLVVIIFHFGIENDIILKESKGAVCEIRQTKVSTCSFNEVK